MKKIIFFLLTLCSAFIWAQLPTIETPDIKGKLKETGDVFLQKLDVDAKIYGNISTTKVTMVFQNKSNRILEGRLTFPLPEGVTVSGYALDINGQLRQAVPVEKERAKEVFETIEKRRVDPGLIEKVEGNNFRTRIYPIPAKGSRTVQITYNMELEKYNNGLGYFYPFDYKKAIQDFSIKVQVFENLVTPKLTERPDGDFDFVKNGNVWTAQIHKINFIPKENLKINIPLQENAQKTLMQKASEGNSYFMSFIDIAGQERVKPLPKKIAVIWDNSLSRSGMDHTKEFQLLDEYFKKVKNVEVEVYFLSNTFDKGNQHSIKNTDWRALKKDLENVHYDGGTDFSTLKEVIADEILLFSDGISSFGDWKTIKKVPVYCIAATPKTDYAKLRYMALQSGGAFINLNQKEVSGEVRKLLYQPLNFIGIKNNAAVSEVYPSMPVVVTNGFSISGILNKKSTQLVLQFGYGKNVAFEKTIELNADKHITDEWEISKFWAQNKISELEIFEKQNKDEILDLGKQFGLVTHNTSLMVLEDINDYVRYKILPPQELRKQYDDIVNNKNRQTEEVRRDIMASAEAKMKELKEWWSKDFTVKKKYPKPERKEVVITPTNALQGQVSGVQIAQGDNARLEEVVAYSVSPSSSNARLRRAEESKSAAVDKKLINDAFSQKGNIRTVEVKSDKEYMKLFAGKNVNQIYSVYLQERNRYFDTPSFYLDVAQLLFKNGNKDLGLKVLSAIADLDLENEELFKTLVYQLKQTGHFEKEYWIAKKILEWRPHDPQSYRDLALAAEDLGKYQEALDNLYKILTISYTNEIANRDLGIEETVLMEINELISLHKNQLDISRINPKLIADLPVNVRVVLNWNKDNTDIDLWVTDPNGERCMYNHKSTEIGGRLSNDFTRGFGPEQFLLKKAIKGKYKIETNFFGDSQVSVSGPTIIMAEVFINYATGRQERKIVVFHSDRKENSTENKEGTLIGEFEF
ncbi:VIT domain-containing protein [Elizabethkingia meningoseptica]|uniref:VIT domain-containing protein n=1 Tax=Elizabethkingia meningoseptica TaxID=238 RepID=UPI0038916864